VLVAPNYTECLLIAGSKYFDNTSTFILNILNNTTPDTIMLNVLDQPNNWLYVLTGAKTTAVNAYYTTTTISSRTWVICYKAVNNDYTSIRDKKLLYSKLNVLYKTECNYFTTVDNGAGFSCWTLDGAKSYAFDMKILDYKIITVRVPLDSMCMLSDGKIRSSQMVIISLSPE